jgi:hypothetical protein
MVSVDLSRKLKDCGEMTLDELVGIMSRSVAERIARVGNTTMEWFADSTGVGWVVPAVGGGTDRIYLLGEPSDGLTSGTEEPGVESVDRLAVSDPEFREIRRR